MGVSTLTPVLFKGQLHTLFVWFLSLVLLHIDVLSHNYCGCIALYVYTTFVHSTVNGSRIVFSFRTL